MAIPNCLSWFVHFVRREASRAACTAGKSSATSTPIIAITTSSSTSVKPTRFRLSAIPINGLLSTINFEQEATGTNTNRSKQRQQRETHYRILCLLCYLRFNLSTPFPLFPPVQFSFLSKYLADRCSIGDADRPALLRDIFLFRI